MYEQKYIILNGEFLGKSVVVNRCFDEIYTISSIIIKDFISVIESIDLLLQPVRIKHYDIINGNIINIYFKNKLCSGQASFFYLLNKENVLIADDWQLVITSGRNKGYYTSKKRQQNNNEQNNNEQNNTNLISFDNMSEKFRREDVNIRYDNEDISAQISEVLTEDSSKEIPEEKDEALTQDAGVNMSEVPQNQSVDADSEKLEFLDYVSADTQEEHINTDEISELQTVVCRDDNTKFIGEKANDKSLSDISDDYVEESVAQESQQSPQIQPDNLLETTMLPEESSLMICEETKNEIIYGFVPSTDEDSVLSDRVSDDISVEMQYESLEGTGDLVSETDIIQDSEVCNQNSFFDEKVELVDFFDIIPRFEADIPDVEFSHVFEIKNNDNNIQNQESTSDFSLRYKSDIERNAKISMYRENLVGYDNQMAELKISKLKQKICELHNDETLTSEDVLDAQIELLLNNKAKAFRILDSNNKNDVLQIDGDLFLSKDKIYRWGDVLTLDD